MASKPPRQASEYSLTPTSSFPETPPSKMISRSIGEELRLTREQLGWSRRFLVARLPSGIGDRTLLSYEHGSRDLSVLRLLELGWAMETDPAKLLTYSLQRARIKLENLNLTIDLHALLRDQNEKFRPMIQMGTQHTQQTPKRDSGNRAIGRAKPSALHRMPLSRPDQLPLPVHT